MKALILTALVPMALTLGACGRDAASDRSDTNGGANSMASPAAGTNDGSNADTRSPDANDPSHAPINTSPEVSGREAQPGEGTGNGPATGTGPNSDTRGTMPRDPTSGTGTPPINGSGGRTPGAPTQTPPITP